jgi:putative DNA primase/helicase
MSADYQPVELPLPELETVRLADVESRPISWLWRDRISFGRLCLLCGDPGVGKSMLTCAISAAVSTRAALPGDGPQVAADVVILSAEDSPEDTIRPRIESMGGDLERVRVVTGVRRDGQPGGYFSLADDLEALERELVQHPAALLIVDPLDAYVGTVIDTHRSAAIRSLLGPLAAMAERTGVAVIAVQHLSKGSRDRPIYRPQGSIAYLAAARTALLVATDPEQPESPTRHVVGLKSNLGPPPVALRFSVEGGTFGWLAGESAATAEALLAGPATEGDRSALAEAEDVLRDLLSSGPRLAGDVIREGAAAGVAERTMKRARQVLGVVTRKRGLVGWEWTLPTSPEVKGPAGDAESGFEVKAPEDALIQNLGIFTSTEVASSKGPSPRSGKAPSGTEDAKRETHPARVSARTRDTDGHTRPDVGAATAPGADVQPQPIPAAAGPVAHAMTAPAPAGSRDKPPLPGNHLRHDVGASGLRWPAELTRHGDDEPDEPDEPPGPEGDDLPVELLALPDRSGAQRA